MRTAHVAMAVPVAGLLLPALGFALDIPALNLVAAGLVLLAVALAIIVG